MGKITSVVVQENNKERCNVFIDGEFACGLSIELVMAYGLKVGEELGKERLEAFIEEDENKSALTKSIEYVSKTLKTKHQVKDYLVRKGYSVQTACYCIDKLIEYKYIDDVEYCKRFIEFNSKTQGRRLIEYKLMSKGIKKSDIVLAYEQLPCKPKESAKTVAEKYMKNKEKTKENTIKTYRYLISRGFSYEEATNAVASLTEED